MNRSSKLLFFAFMATGLGQTDAANPVGTPADAPRVRQVLTWESSNESISLDRRAALQPTVHPETATNAAWWQAGFVKTSEGWHHAEKTLDDTNSPLIEEYRELRDSTPKTAEGQLKLANWCQTRKLTDQERAHLWQVLSLSPLGSDQTLIYKRMGFRQLGQSWVSPTEFASLQESSRRTAEHLRRWQPAIERIVRNSEGNARQRKLAEDELHGIETTSAIPALMIISIVNESLALRVCERLSAMTSFEASLALATMSVKSDWPTVRQAATKSLKVRRVDDFASALLSEMRSPFQTQMTKAVDGIATEPKLIFREESDRYYVVDLRFVPSGVGFNSVAFYRKKWDYVTPRYFNVSPERFRTQIDSARLIDDVDHSLQLRIDDENDRAEEYNRRAGAVLAEVTGQEESLNPQYWWTWWSLHTGTDAPPKRVEIDRQKIRIPGKVYYDALIISPSCLVSGTPICTDRGLVAVDQLQVGDRVLSKHIDTGEIQFKPIIHTTVRHPVPVKKFVVVGQSIVASDGHHFWSSGSGWSKTRELKPGTPLHTATGMSRVESVESQPDLAPVYNLVVADFHTYFVGPAMVLSHDVLQPAPTNIKVPGLDIE